MGRSSRVLPSLKVGAGSRAGTGDRCRSRSAPEAAEPGDGVARRGSRLCSRRRYPVVDADGLAPIGTLEGLRIVVGRRRFPTVITPHDGELTRLAGKPPRPRPASRSRPQAAQRSTYIVLLKGSTSVIAAPSQEVFLYGR